MKRIINFILIILCIASSYAQNNLIINGSFEDHLICPPYIAGGIFNGLIPNVSNPSLYTPDYFNSCDSSFQQFFSIPLNLKGNQYPKSGNAYIGIATWEYQSNQKEYIQMEVNMPLLINHHYLFSCYISLAEVSDYSNADFGVHFDSDSLFFSTFNSIPLIPQIINSSGNFFSDTSLWMQFTGIYLAQGNEKFIIIGNFNNNNFNPPDTLKIQPTGTQGSGTYYYIDDVSLIDLDSTLSLKENEAMAQVEVFPNPASSVLTIKLNAPQQQYSITDIKGNTLMQNSISNQEQIQIDITTIPSGFYVINFINKQGYITREKFVKL
ncbi:MAG TPA: T9SS type A sorting domain-containing protein [Bacteroidia bacterium]|nr:T9SS type A sorting domain-containing protein [Bacteroidia bacterium]